ncbi:MAG: hypothetical protein AAB443_00385 [Patescibacteria group bacterium]
MKQFLLTFFVLLLLVFGFKNLSALTKKEGNSDAKEGIDRKELSSQDEIFPLDEETSLYFIEYDQTSKLYYLRYYKLYGIEAYDEGIGSAYILEDANLNLPLFNRKYVRVEGYFVKGDKYNPSVRVTKIKIDDFPWHEKANESFAPIVKIERFSSIETGVREINYLSWDSKTYVARNTSGSSLENSKETSCPISASLLEGFNKKFKDTIEGSYKINTLEKGDLRIFGGTYILTTKDSRKFSLLFTAIPSSALCLRDGLCGKSLTEKNKNYGFRFISSYPIGDLLFFDGKEIYDYLVYITDIGREACTKK